MSDTSDREADKEYMAASSRMHGAIKLARQRDKAAAEKAINEVRQRCEESGDLRTLLDGPDSETRDIRMAYIKDITEAMEAITGPSEES